MPTRKAEQIDRTLIHRTDPAITIKSQQPFAELTDIFGLGVEAQQPLAFIAAQEMAAFDGLGRQVDQRHGVELALPRHVMPRRRHIQHRQQLTMRVEHRAGRAGQPGVPATEVFILVDGQRLALDQAGANAIGAFAGFAPIGTKP